MVVMVVAAWLCGMERPGFKGAIHHLGGSPWRMAVRMLTMQRALGKIRQAERGQQGRFNPLIPMDAR